jgi:hypothetical protein
MSGKGKKGKSNIGDPIPRSTKETQEEKKRKNTSVLQSVALTAAEEASNIEEKGRKARRPGVLARAEAEEAAAAATAMILDEPQEEPSAIATAAAQSDTAMDLQEDTEEGCNAFTYFPERPEKLIPYEQSLELHVTGDAVNTIGELNTCNEILERLVFLTRGLPSPPVNNFVQQNLSCIENQDETVRVQGLFDIEEIRDRRDIMDLRIDQLSKLNMLTGGDVNQKFAVPSGEGNPNGVLAVALYEAIAALKYYSKNLPQAKKPTKADIASWIGHVNGIFSASRKQGKSDDDSSSYTEIADIILSVFNEAIGTISDTDKFVWLFKVYGPFLNKGLSDISQAGELAKFYVLKYIQERFRPAYPRLTPTSSPIALTGEHFWETTMGLPSLSAYSSDTIASALGVRIQNLFKGQFQSICPRKHERGNFMVVYIPYNYMSLMYLIACNELPSTIQGVEIFSPGIRDKIQKTKLFDRLIEIKQNFMEVLTASVVIDGVNLITEGAFDDDYFFISLRELVYDIYRVYKDKTRQKDNFFSENILSIISNFIKPEYTFTESEQKDLIYYINKFYTLYTQKSIIELNQYGTENKVRTLKSCFETIQSILLFFGSMIEELHTLISNPDINKLLQDIWLDIKIPTIELPTWTGILYSTISYYDNCLNFSQQTDGQLLNKFLDISKMEIKCAIQDVDKGHDQSAKQVGDLGEKFAREAVKLSQDELALRPSQYYGHANNQKVFSKKLINTLKYCSVALSYDIYGNPVLKVINSKQKDDSGNYTGTDYDSDFMFDTETAISDPTKIVASISGIGSAENLGSIDYLKGKVSVLVASKTVLVNDFQTYEDMVKYFLTANIIELRFATTNYDQAAPSGCLYRNVGNQCLSYLPININGKDYMYVISTIDLNHAKHKNSLELNSDACASRVAGADIFKIGEEDIELKNITVAISSKIPHSEEKRNYPKKIGDIMLALLNNCYKIPGNQLRQQIEAIFGRKIVDMFDSLNGRRLQAEQPEVRGNGKAVSQFPKESVIAFEAIVDKIKEKYKECKNTNQDECLQFLKNFLTILYSCFFSKNPPTTEQRRTGALGLKDMALPIERGAQTGQTGKMLLGLSNTPWLSSVTRGSTAATAINPELGFGVNPSYQKQRAYAASSSSGFGQGFGATAATAINPEKGFGTIPQNSALEFFAEAARIPTQGSKFYIDKTSPSHQQSIANPEYIKRQNEVLRRMANQYPGENTYNLYSQALTYWLNQEKRINIFEEGVEDQMEAIESFYRSQRGGRNRKLMSQRYKNINTRKLYKIYKRNKRNTKRKINKRVRKTKKRHIKGKRITRRR